MNWKIIEKWKNKRAVISDSRVCSYHLMKTKKPRRIRYAMYNKLSANWKMLEGINVTSANTTPLLCGIWWSMRPFRMLSIVWYKTVSLYCSIGCSQSSHTLSSQEIFFTEIQTANFEFVPVVIKDLEQDQVLYFKKKFWWCNFFSFLVVPDIDKKNWKLLW